MIFCGIFDGHGPWGHFVAKRVRETMPRSLLCNWQETLAAQSSSSLDNDHVKEIPDNKQQRFNIWKHSYLKTCASIDQELEHSRKFDSFHSGTTALSIVRQVNIQKQMLDSHCHTFIDLDSMSQNLDLYLITIFCNMMRCRVKRLS